MRINFCFFKAKKSVKAINQHKTKKGRIEYPIIKVASGLKLVLRKIIIRKEIASGSHGFAKPIHESPTKIKFLLLYLK